MDEDKKKALGLGIFILILILFAVGMFIWGFFNKGRLVFQGDMPFSVLILGETELECRADPCEVRLPAGVKDIFAEKEGHRNVYVEERVRRWRTVEVELNFRMLPVLMETENMPIVSPTPKYELATERATGNQVLIKETDTRRFSVVYFTKPLSSPRVIGDVRFVLVIDRDIYKIDSLNNTREEIVGLNPTGIKDVKWSMDGRYMLFERENENGLRLFDTRAQEEKELSLTTELRLVDWVYDNSLVFLTTQNHRVTSGSDEEGYPYATFFGEISAGYTLGVYYPERTVYSRVETFPEITSAPEEFVALANGQSVYLQIEGENFKIFLRKF